MASKEKMLKTQVFAKKIAFDTDFDEKQTKTCGKRRKTLKTQVIAKKTAFATGNQKIETYMEE